MDRQIIEYLPDYMREYREIQAIMSGEQREMEEMYNRVFQILNNNFIRDSDEAGISRYEKLLSIHPKAEDTLEDRRIRVQSDFLDHKAYTMANLRNYLSFILGEYGYEVRLRNREYALDVRVPLKNGNKAGIVEAYLKKNLPANIIVNITIKFNNHSDIRELMHKNLKQRTHEYIKNEVL